MDIAQIDEFFNYKPFFGEDSQSIVDEITKKAGEYLPADQLPLIQKAYEFTRDAHAEVQRLSGEPYIVHPLRATLFLMEIKPDIASIQTCILHDVIEDTPITYEDIAKTFGEEIANLCEGLVKVSKIKYRGEDRQIETLKKTFLAMAKDLRVIFIKLADRIHNIQTLHYHPKKEKQEKIATETMKIYVPIAKRLGLYHYQLYLENGCFNILHPNEFQRIVQFMKKHFPPQKWYVDQWIKKLTQMLHKEWIKEFVIKGRLKSPYRIREKMENKYKSPDFSNVMDMLAFRLITNDITDAYLSLGIVHKYFTPMIKKIKDYIAVPKFNGYKSIHTTIIGMFDFPVEIQIRTKQMDEVAEYGVAAHFGYSEQWGATSVAKTQSEWIKKLQDLVNTFQNIEDKEAFKDQLNIEMLNKSIYVYTPKGDIIELTQGASVLDFAFHVHSEIGLKFKNALVNREIKPISYIPKTGDIIMIQTRKNKYTANKAQLDYLHTPSARSHLTRFLKIKERENIIKNVISELNKKLKDMWLPLFRAQEDKISKVYDTQEFERKCIEIADKKSSYFKLIKSVYPDEVPQNKEVPKAKTIKNVRDQAIIDGDNLLNYELCPECKPNIEDKIIAKSGRHGIKIHAMRCKALKTVSYSNLLEAHRDGQDNNQYNFSMIIEIPHKYGNIIDMMQKLGELHLNIHHIGVKNNDNQNAEMSLDVIYTNPAQIDLLGNELKKYTDARNIKKRLLQ